MNMHGDRYFIFQEPWSETQQERLQLQRARVLEVNRHLAALTEGGERGGFPLQLNLAVHGSPGAQQLQQQAAAAQRYRHQNFILTEVRIFLLKFSG